MRKTPGKISEIEWIRGEDGELFPLPTTMPPVPDPLPTRKSAARAATSTQPPSIGIALVGNAAVRRRIKRSKSESRPAPPQQKVG
jgi:hypothetical protein